MMVGCSLNQKAVIGLEVCDNIFLLLCGFSLI